MLVELNCENLFDCRHDTLKQDEEWLPDAMRHWNSHRYWQKLTHLAQELIACGGDSASWHLPDLVALTEVENDSVMRDLARRSLLRQARYDYVMTDSPDLRGIDVALLYSPFAFRLLRHEALRVEPLPGMRPTRDILYAAGEVMSGDTLHVFVVHAPSRYGGERHTRPFRMAVAQRLAQAIDSIRRLSPDAMIIATGDFNDGAKAPALRFLRQRGLNNISAQARGMNGAHGTYKYEGRWQSIDHILVSAPLLPAVGSCTIHDAPFLLEQDTKNGGVQPRRNYRGFRYNNGYSDHLPLVARFLLPDSQRTNTD